MVSLLVTPIDYASLIRFYYKCPFLQTIFYVTKHNILVNIMLQNSSTLSLACNAPVPYTLDRTDFMEWFRGFTDGEGAFLIHNNRPHPYHTIPTSEARGEVRWPVFTF